MEAVYRVRVAGTGESFPCRGDEFVLEAMRRSGGGPIRHGCHGGGCGVCKMRVLGGEYALCKPMSRAHVSEREQEQGTVLLCCIKPRGDLLVARVGG